MKLPELNHLEENQVSAIVAVATVLAAARLVGGKFLDGEECKASVRMADLIVRTAYEQVVAQRDA